MSLPSPPGCDSRTRRGHLGLREFRGFRVYRVQAAGSGFWGLKGLGFRLQGLGLGAY